MADIQPTHVMKVLPRTQYVTNLGMETNFQFHDVFGLDADLLGMIPSPCVSLLLLFPINEKVSTFQQPHFKVFMRCIDNDCVWSLAVQKVGTPHEQL